MKFFKKLALITSSSSISHCDVPVSTDANVIPVDYLHQFTKLADTLKQWLNRTITGICAAHSDSIKHSRVTNWAPLIKTSPRMRNPDAVTKTQRYDRNCSLAGQSVLCVGGRMKFYPAYKQSVHHAGGSLITFHGDSNDRPNNLPRMLRQADMIICPIDCVNHEDYFAIKNYCQLSGKPCVLLDRSEINTFTVGIQMLMHMTVNGSDTKELT
jgi:hypothetical protein